MSKSQVRKVQARVESLVQARRVSLANARLASKAKFRKVSKARAARLADRIRKLRLKLNRAA